MLTTPLALSLLALGAALGTPLMPSADASAALAQKQADAPPEGASSQAPGDEASGPRARMNERRKQKQAAAEGLDPLLTRGLQVGVGAATCGVCMLGYCGLTVGIGIPLGILLAPVASVPLLTAFITGVIDAALCGTVGLSVGAVEVLIGNLFGAEEGSLLWPALAGAGVGVGASLVGTAAGIALPFTGHQPPELTPGDPVALDDLIALSNPAALLLQAVTLSACVLGCAAIPLVPALVYGLTAAPKATLQATASELESSAPALAPFRTAMAY